MQRARSQLHDSLFILLISHSKVEILTFNDMHYHTQYKHYGCIMNSSHYCKTIWVTTAHTLYNIHKRKLGLLVINKSLTVVTVAPPGGCSVYIILCMLSTNAQLLFVMHALH